MTGVGYVAVVLGIFFLLGIWVGVIGVVALAARRNDKDDAGSRTLRRRSADEADEIGWREPPGPGTWELGDDVTDDDVTDDDDRPQWPGSGYRALTSRESPASPIPPNTHRPGADTGDRTGERRLAGALAEAPRAAGRPGRG